MSKIKYLFFFSVVVDFFLPPLLPLPPSLSRHQAVNMAFPMGRPSPLLLLHFLLLLWSSKPLQARPLLLHPSINVAVVFSGSSYQNEVRGRLSGENFVDLPVVVSPVTVLVNDTNPRDLLTRLCDTMSTERLHGVVFEDDVGSGAGVQVKCIHPFLFYFLFKQKYSLILRFILLKFYIFK